MSHSPSRQPKTKTKAVFHPFSDSTLIAETPIISPSSPSPSSPSHNTNANHSNSIGTQAEDDDGKKDSEEEKVQHSIGSGSGDETNNHPPPTSSRPPLSRRRTLLPRPISNSTSPLPDSSPSPSPSSPNKIITVHLPPDPPHFPLPRNIPIEIVPPPPSSHPKIGGYRHRVTGVHFPHCFTQTDRNDKKKKGVGMMITRTTQTVDIVERGVEMSKEEGTQMEREDLLTDCPSLLSPPLFFPQYSEHFTPDTFSSSSSISLSPSPYPKILYPSTTPITAAEVESQRDIFANDIQSYIRQCLSLSLLRQRKEEREKEKLRMQNKAMDEERKQKEKYENDIQRRINPRNKGDFDILMKELNIWRERETKKIKEKYYAQNNNNNNDDNNAMSNKFNSTTSTSTSSPIPSIPSSSSLPESSRLALESDLRHLLTQEVKILQAIDRLKLSALQENRHFSIQKLLEKMSSSYRMKSTEGWDVEISTVESRRAKTLVEMYNGLCVEGMDNVSRGELLADIQREVQGNDSVLSREIIQLIERENDMIQRCRPPNTYQALRKRLLSTYLKYIQSPVFNPRIAEFVVEGGMNTWTDMREVEEKVRRKKEEERKKEEKRLRENRNKMVREVVDADGKKRKEIVWKTKGYGGGSSSSSRTASGARREKGEMLTLDSGSGSGRVNGDNDRKSHEIGVGVGRVDREDEDGEEGEEDEYHPTESKSSSSALSSMSHATNKNPSSVRATSVGPLMDSSVDVHNLDNENNENNENFGTSS